MEVSWRGMGVEGRFVSRIIEEGGGELQLTSRSLRTE